MYTLSWSVTVFMILIIPVTWRGIMLAFTWTLSSFFLIYVNAFVASVFNYHNLVLLFRSIIKFRSSQEFIPRNYISAVAASKEKNHYARIIATLPRDFARCSNHVARSLGRARLPKELSLYWNSIQDQQRCETIVQKRRTWLPIGALSVRRPRECRVGQRDYSSMSREKRDTFGIKFRTLFARIRRSERVSRRRWRPGERIPARSRLRASRSARLRLKLVLQWERRWKKPRTRIPRPS